MHGGGELYKKVAISPGPSQLLRKERVKYPTHYNEGNTQILLVRLTKPDQPLFNLITF